jgi:hypothetical protein
MPARRAEPAAATGRDAVSSDAQIMRAFIAVAAGMMLAFWVLRPLCANPNLRTMLPEHRVLAGIPALVI